MESPAPNSPAQAEFTSGAWRCELLCLIAGVVLFVLINGFTADKTPAPWCDEVMYLDPAVNLYQGHGFTSGAWYAQDMDKFWAGNVPLYQFVLLGWLKFFGFGITSVRSFHYVMFGLATFVGWWAIRRLGLVSSPRYRLLFCLVLLLCSSSAFVYRSARPESLVLLISAFALFAFSIRARGLRLFLLALSGGLLLWSGLQMGVYLFLLGGIWWLNGVRRFRLEVAILCAGSVAAMGLLYLFYTNHGVWGDFVASIRYHTIANEVESGYGVGLKNGIKKLPTIYQDYSFFPLLIIVAWIGWRLARARQLRRGSPFLFGVLTAMVVPLVLYVVGVFPLYYFWMAFLPLALGVCSELGRVFERSSASFARCSIFILLVAVCAVGLPRRLAVAAFDWHARSYQPVMKLVAPYVPSDATVFSEFSAYYAAKQNGARVVVPTGLQPLRDEDRKRISVAILHNPDAGSLARGYGGEWKQVDSLVIPPASGLYIKGLTEKLGSYQYNLTVYVRVR